MGRGKYKATKARGSGNIQKRHKKKNPHSHKRADTPKPKISSKNYSKTESQIKAKKLTSRAESKKEKIRRVKLITKTDSL